MKTGKRVKNVTKLTKTKNLAKFKKELLAKIKDDEDGYDPSEISAMKATDFKFFISNEGKVVICFGPYELGFGGWTKFYEFEGNF